MRNRIPVLCALISALILASGCVTTIAAVDENASASQTPAPAFLQWPSFTMVYRETSYSFSSGDEPGYQLIQLDYTDFLNWRVTLLEAPNAMLTGAGAWSAFENGTTMVSYNPVIDEEPNRKDVNVEEEGFYVPNEWLRPVYIQKMKEQPNADVQVQSTDDPGLEKLVITEQSPCTTLIIDDARRRAGVEECSSEEEMRTGIMEITYTVEHQIPVKIESKLDGIATYTMTVEKLEFKSP